MQRVGLFIYFVCLVAYYMLLIKYNASLIPERFACMHLHVLSFIQETSGDLWAVWSLELSVDLRLL